jgi:integral membrane protein
MAARTNAALLRYRVIAIVVGIGLLALVLIGMPLKYLGDNSSVVAIVGPAHGALYVLYLIAAFELSQRSKWSWKGTLAVLLAGTIPFLSFVAERIVTRTVQAQRRL